MTSLNNVYTSVLAEKSWIVIKPCLEQVKFSHATQLRHYGGRNKYVGEQLTSGRFRRAICSSLLSISNWSVTHGAPTSTKGRSSDAPCDIKLPIQLVQPHYWWTEVE